MRRIVGAILAIAAMGAGIALAIGGRLAGQVVRSSGNGVFTIVVSDIRWPTVLPLLAVFVLGLVMLLRPIPSR
jgi:hypothetical protein